MIKQATIYKIAGQINAALKQLVPIGPTDQRSTGWIPPRGTEHDPLAELNSNALVLCFAVETRQVPSATVAEKLSEAVKQIEVQTGRKPGKKEKRDLKEDIVHTLLPHAFPKRKTATVLVIGDHLVIGSTSSAITDEVITALVSQHPEMVISNLDTQTSPSAAMAHWLAEQEAPAGFDIGKACELKAADESSAKVRYTNHPLLTDEVLDHLAQGKVPTSLAMTFDDRISFVLTDRMQLKKISVDDKVMEQIRENGLNPGDFDGTAAIAIGEIKSLLPNLISALGGEATIPTPQLPQADTGEKKPAAQPVPLDGEPDPMLEQARKVVCAPDGRASISYLQRKLMIGFNRAARLLEALEADGVVGQMEPNGYRAVIGAAA